MRNRLRAVSAAIVATLTVLVFAPTAHARPLDEIVVAHRGATTSTIAEGTMPAYRYAVRHHADYLDGDIRWAKDGVDADSVGAMVISHDATLNRVTNCSGNVSSWLWSSIYKKCRTEIGHQRLIRLVDLLKYGRSVGKPLTLEVKPSSITNAQARQLWNAVRHYRVQLEAGAAALPSLKKIKKLDAADPHHRISYALVTSGGAGWPSVTKIKAIGPNVHAHLTIPARVVRTYERAGIRVYLFTAKSTADYARVAKLSPYGVVVDDIGKFQRWRSRNV